VHYTLKCLDNLLLEAAVYLRWQAWPVELAVPAFIHKQHLQINQLHTRFCYGHIVVKSTHSAHHH